MAKLEAIDVGVSFVNPRTGNTVTALSNVNFQIAPKEFISVVGPSGCGKTTLLNCIDGLIPISSGELRLDGRAIRGPGPERAVVFQSPSLLPWRTVIRNVTYGLELQHVPLKDARDSARAMLKLVGLSGFEEHRPAELSGGMQQRVNLARALILNPEVILLDEPFASLDAQTREFMQAELLRIWGEISNTAVFITHQIDEAIYLADRVIVMSARPGRIKEVVPISLGRPRDLSMKHTPEFMSLQNRIWGLIEEEARQSFAQLDQGAQST